MQMNQIITDTRSIIVPSTVTLSEAKGLSPRNRLEIANDVRI